MSPRPQKSTELMTDRELILDMHHRIVGDGTENNPGLDKRVDRLEGFTGRAKWVIGIVGATVIGFAMERVKKMFGGA